MGGGDVGKGMVQAGGEVVWGLVCVGNGGSGELSGCGLIVSGLCWAGGVCDSVCSSVCKVVGSSL